MDALRWVLLIIGIVIFLVIYLVSRKKQQDSIRPVDLAPDDDFELPPSMTAVHQEVEDFDQLAKSMRLDEMDLGLQPEQTNKTSQAPASTKPKQAGTGGEALLIYYLVAKDNAMMSGVDVVQALEDAGLRYGDMKIFHFHDGAEPDSPVIFSIANLTEPGWFNLTEINNMQTPGVTLFANVPASRPPLKTLDSMITVIDRLRQALPVVLRDRQRNRVSRQILTHMREELAHEELKKNRQG